METVWLGNKGEPQKKKMGRDIIISVKMLRLLEVLVYSSVAVIQP